MPLHDQTPTGQSPMGLRPVAAREPALLVESGKRPHSAAHGLCESGLCQRCANELAELAARHRAALDAGVQLLVVCHSPGRHAGQTRTGSALAVSMPEPGESPSAPQYDVAARGPGGNGWLLYRKRCELRPQLVLIDCQGRMGWIAAAR